MNDNGDDEAVYKSSRDFLGLKNAIALSSLEFLNFKFDTFGKLLLKHSLAVASLHVYIGSPMNYPNFGC